MVQRYPLFHDERLGGTCFHCGGSSPDTVDHVPPRVFLDKPYPDDLITVRSCSDCNSGSSDAERYVASLIEVVVCGTTDPRALERRKISKTLERRPRLREELARAATFDNGVYIVRPEFERVNLVLEKIARGLWRFDSAQDAADLKATVHLDLAPLSAEMSDVFFSSSRPGLSAWGEIGSRGFIRSVCGGEESRYGPGWEDVRVGRFSCSVDSGGDRVRMIFSDYLHADVRLVAL